MITQLKNGENVPNLKITELLLTQYHVAYNSYQQKSNVLNTFVPNKSFGQLSEVALRNLILSITFNSEFSLENR